MAVYSSARLNHSGGRLGSPLPGKSAPRSKRSLSSARVDDDDGAAADVCDADADAAACDDDVDICDVAADAAECAVSECVVFTGAVLSLCVGSFASNSCAPMGFIIAKHCDIVRTEQDH